MKNWLRCLGLGLFLTYLFSLTGCSSENNGSVGISSSLLGGNGIPYSVSAQGLRIIQMNITNTGSQTLNNLHFSFSGKTYGKFFINFEYRNEDINFSTISCSSIPAGQTCKLGISYYAEGSAITAPINQNITLTMSNDVVSTSQTVNITVYPDVYPFAAGITNQTFQVVSDYTGVTSVPGYVSDGNEVYPYNFLNSEGGNPYWPFGFSMIPINVFGSEHPLVMSSDGNGMYFLTPTKLYYCLGSAQNANNCQFVALPNGTQNPSEYHLIAYASVVLLSLDDKAYYIQPGQLTLNEIPFANGNTYPITSLLAVNVNDIYQSQLPENRIYAYAAQSPTSGMLYEFNPYNVTVPLTVNFEPLIADREILGFYNTSSLTYYEVVIPGQNGLYFVNDPTDDLMPVTPIGANYTFLKTLNYGYSNILGLVKASNSNAAYLLIMQAGDDMISPAVLNTINLNEDIYPHYDLRGPSTSIYISNGQEVKEFDALNPEIFPCDDEPSLCQLTTANS